MLPSTNVFIAKVSILAKGICFNFAPYMYFCVQQEPSHSPKKSELDFSSAKILAG